MPLLLKAAVAAVFLFSLAVQAAAPAVKSCTQKDSWEQCDACCAQTPTAQSQTDCKVACSATFKATEVSERACGSRADAKACDACCGESMNNEFRDQCRAVCQKNFTTKK